MANPQIENGFTKIANEIIEAMIKVNLSGHEFRIALFVIRKTYGFNRKEDAISLSQMHKSTGLSITRCSQIINSLQLKKVITITENCKGRTKKYTFNKDFDEWQNTCRKLKGTITEKCKKHLQKTASTKDSIKEKKEIEEISASKQSFDAVSFSSFLLLKRAEEENMNEDAVRGINFFLLQYKRHRQREHPDLRPEQWNQIIKTFMFCDYEGKTLYLNLIKLKSLIHEYFNEFNGGNILDFSGMKLRRSFEADVC